MFFFISLYLFMLSTLLVRPWKCPLVEGQFITQFGLNQSGMKERVHGAEGVKAEL